MIRVEGLTKQYGPVRTATIRAKRYADFAALLREVGALLDAGDASRPDRPDPPAYRPPDKGTARFARDCSNVIPASRVGEVIDQGGLPSHSALLRLDPDQCDTHIPQPHEDAVQLGLVDGSGAQGGRAVGVVDEVGAAGPRRPMRVEVAANADLVHLGLRAHHVLGSLRRRIAHSATARLMTQP
ncbi:MAG: hypothetical protein WCA30_18860, partial [Dermatophilaceae bacterium]